MSVKIGTIDLGEFPLLLAPMEDVSDPPFRYVCKQNGVDLMYTEFISSEGLIRDAAKSRQKLDVFEYERPIGIQIFGSDIDHMFEATEIATQANPDLIDINYGCPVKNVACRGAGSALLQDIDKMVAMTAAVVKATHLPVTVKTRLGWDDNTKNIYEVAERLQDVGIQALSIHGRTRAQMYKGEADWTLIKEVKKNPRIKIPIFGNGDVDSAIKAANWRLEYEIDGIMIGRAAIGYPWIFREVKHFFKTGQHLEGPTIDERVDVCLTHLRKSVEWKGPKTGIFEMRRHYANYFKGVPNFKEYRMKLVSLDSIETIEDVLNDIRNKFDTVLV
ncbi:tRNA-U20-dihydrouridine synthase [Pseudopedobacter saltans DSM 12145]|uniref:tRNA-dihydrouridine synthase n=1 Tax=Pseudopedobacter saltans (strain ATCC 51119 / DSM 12145 / JCM 21818 / CCUG 39354 / LMG 10337 / NBRC 100064 / NCIMB 13643) TaxID=762903 RepID=F0S8Y9_PSESL|nr:tRNA dihydrouridine synthase DusB [Pseudopedobacter saltans]ADY53476.1 tRNA-U20-dihydrouridine synthase [Pseudopedobacter saltans DSM 12145]